ncbi:MAG: amino acid adenylation domain protein, partial [Pedosphaera sp.]|nr:amino acid adenylation domain protein [Pedosphaera sp.]
PVPLPLTDLRHLPEPERMTRAMELAVAEARVPFDLRTGPLLRAQLLQLADDDHLLLMTFHHIAIDGWSRGVFLRELTALYPAFLAGKISPLPPLPIQYADFAVWQSQWMQDEVLLKHLSYWKQQLAGAPALLEWPADFTRPEVQSYRGARLPILLPKALADALAALSQREGCTMFMTLLAAFQALAARYTRSEDIVVGTPIANRNHAEIEGLIGGFVNTLAMRVNLSGDPSFRQVMARVRETALAAYAHQDLPFEKLVEELHPSRSQSYNPIFQVMFIFQNSPMPVLQTAGLHIQPFEIDTGASKFDLTVNLEETPAGLGGWVEFATDLFQPESITRLLGHYQTLLEAVAANPDQPIDMLPLVTGTERRQLLETWNTSQRTYPHAHCVHDLFELQAAATPDSTAVVCDESRLTYAELNERSNQLAHYLRRCGLQRGARVGISLGRSIDMAVGLYAILKAGGAYIPLDPTYPRERLASMLQDARASFLLTRTDFLERLPTDEALKTVCIDHEKEAIARESRENPVPVAQPSDLIYIIYTSGSTGRPKGAGVYHQGFNNLVHWFVEEFAFSETDRAFMISSPSFDLTQKIFFGPLIRGGELHLLPDGPYDPTLISDLIEKNRITLINGTPSAFYPVIEPATAEQCRKVASLRCVFLGGEPISLPRLRPWLENEHCHAEVDNTYGPTECTDISAFYRMNRANMDRYEFVPTGGPIYNAQLTVVNPQLVLCPINVPGELCIGGVGVGAGYVNDPALTAAKFVTNPFPEISSPRLYKTGDLARYLPDGNIQFLGRLDHQVKVRGFRIELREIEHALASHPAVSEAVVVLYHAPAGSGAATEGMLAAYYTCHGGDPADAGELRRFLLQKLPDYMVPSAFVCLKKFPLSTNGKVDRKALPTPEQ